MSPERQRTSSLLAIILLLTAETTAYVTIDRLRAQSHDLAASLVCGEKGSIAYCLSNLVPELAQWRIEHCLVDAGCTEPEARIEALWVMNKVLGEIGDPDHLDERRNEDLAALYESLGHQPPPPPPPPRNDFELRRRQGAKGTDTAATHVGGGFTTPAKGPKTTEVKPTEPKPAATTAPATTADPTTSSSSSSSSSSAEVETVIVTASASSLPTTTTGRPPVCFTESLVSINSCPVESTGISSGKALSCFPTTVPTSVCAEGLICKSDSQGNPSCMYADNKFGAAGVVIALFFAVAVTAAASLMVFLCCRERKEQRKMAKAAEAALIAQEAAAARGAGKKVPAVNVREVMGEEEQGVRRPLMPDGSGNGYGGHAGGMQDPFGDQHRVS